MTSDQQRLSETYDLLLAHLELWNQRLLAAHLIPEAIRARLLQEKTHLLSVAWSPDIPFQEWKTHIGRHKALTGELLHVLARAGLAEQKSVELILVQGIQPQTQAQSIPPPPPPVPGYQPSGSAWSSSSYFTSSSWWSS